MSDGNLRRYGRSPASYLRYDIVAPAGGVLVASETFHLDSISIQRNGGFTAWRI